ncbi:MAG: fumarylacetoacetate hydrolase family protein [Burkholderiales bacterium]|nr:fumarylacetoacetate hydrolase family protein [Burkholderiales bacterium]
MAVFNPRISFDTAPWRLSGVVYGTLLNDRAALAAIGDAANQPPYKAAPKAPVLYVKPRNTLANSGSTVAVPDDAGEFEIGASLGLVFVRTACRVSEADAIAHLAGYTLVADLSVPHDSFYRPSVRFKARDGSCVFGPRVVSCNQIASPDRLTLRVSVDGQVVHSASNAGMQRSVARLIAEVTDFMTLRAGDVLLLGVAAGAPRVRVGQRLAIESDVSELGRLEGSIVQEATTQEHAA